MLTSALHVPTKRGLIYTPQAEAVLNLGFAFKKGLGEGISRANGANMPKVLVSEGTGNLDKREMATVIEQAFGKRLASGYFDRGDILHIFYYPNYEGLAIVKQLAGIPYLDKLAVANNAKGIGMGKNLIAEIIDYYYKLLWRASLDNPANCMYFKACQWTATVGNWNIYWINLEMGEILPALVSASLLEKTIV